jgi:hypothetical protein
MTYTWRPATGVDVAAIVEMAINHFQTEIDLIFKPEPIAYARNLTLAIVNQFYSPSSELVSIAVDNTNKIVAYTWAKAGERAPWSDDAMVVVKMAHLDLTLSSRDRIILVKDMMRLWERFALMSATPIVCSTTMRRDQTAFLKLHERQGYDVRGSYAYKKLNTTPTGLPIP